MPNSAHSAGYTLVELLVVLTIMALVAIGAFFNLRTLRQDQDLKTVSSDIQSKIRNVQTNASSSVNCIDGNMALSWEARLFKDKVQTRCEYSVTSEQSPHPVECDEYSATKSSRSCEVSTLTLTPSYVSIKTVCQGTLGCASEPCNITFPEPAQDSHYVSVLYSPVFRNTQFKSTDWAISCVTNGVKSIENATSISLMLENSNITDPDFQSSTILIEKGGVIRGL